MMKKIFFITIMAMLVVGVQAVERKFIDGYTIKPSRINNRSAEGGLSLLDNKLAFSRNDTVYVAEQNDSLDIQSLTAMPDLSNLGMEGQFAQYGKTIIFSKGGVLYMAELVNKKWGNAQKLNIEGLGGGRTAVRGTSFAARRWTYKIPTVTGLYNPAITKNGRRLYYVADLKDGVGGKDIWYSDRKPDGKSWSAPQNLKGVNSEGDEDFPYLAGDTAFYFSSTRPDTLGGSNIFKTTLKANSAPVMLAAEFNSNGSDANFVVANGCPFLISDRNGDADIYRPARLVVSSAESVPVDSAATDTTPTNVVMKDYNTCVFYFDFDKTTLIDSYDKEFEYIYDFINAFPDSKFSINGHTDARGSDEYNQPLSENRARMVYNRLVKMGVNKNRMTVKGFGKKQLDIKNATTDDEHQKNRRVEIIKLDNSQQ